ncbi:LEAF RUST 10 DISEASE-RESISTANCE LOCUS RECEPTOR-LIKE PROTEIN KINASE-like 2.1 [Vicia villosa]|uniref:LEAF RUST 10 DISEASE-RESISTANCE LOCUS RECEPTOR-LIKE PROTEIN KINASE-like 2.1 n=1 Tax=Vicia villosa TaxID=3911 RepID=UPI00273C9B41|nr:LEAF RUST 10 DISEASE-RESISTANCE LOCUS RECEPTOR-LIKE PROTEIN KINASE-like 2.1 [Vicia villosa]
MIQLEENARITELTGSVDQNTITLSDQDFYTRLQSNVCDTLNRSYPLPPPSPLVSFYINSNVTLFRCNRSHNINPPAQYFKYPCPSYDIYYNRNLYPNDTKENAHSLFSSCLVLQFPSKDLTDTKNILSFVSGQLSVKIELSADCEECSNNSGGQCRLNANNKFYCHNVTDTKKKGLIWRVKLGIGAMGVVIGIAVLILLAYAIRKNIFPRALPLFRKESSTHQNIKEFLKEQGPLLAARYNYLDVKKITNSFKSKLGQGGYGSVYKGKLHDDRMVAVKVLSESKGDGEDFINEVASISRTSHVNVVRLLGFCLDGSKKALIYEFMPNGSLEKFIYEEKNPVRVGLQLNCKTLYDIALGVARGLEYLHRGCNTRILHFDIKPHNILLDEDFCPKISDFGLAKICPRKESIVSIFGARGTPGYIAPELFSRSFGNVSHKSDVYSYGMMVLEMVGRRKNIKIEVDCSSELYFPHWIYKRLELNLDLGLKCIKNEIDEEMVRKMTVVSLWCIQTSPSNRPSMHKVVEMLEGNLQVLEMPPKPFLSSPSTSPTHLSSEIL